MGRVGEVMVGGMKEGVFRKAKASEEVVQEAGVMMVLAVGAVVGDPGVMR